MLPTACLLPPAFCRLLSAACFLPPAFCVLLAAACALPPAYCRLPGSPARQQGDNLTNSCEL
jgi:hypothetical protein